MKVLALASLTILMTACSSRPSSPTGGLPTVPPPDSGGGAGTGGAKNGTGGAVATTGGAAADPGGAGPGTGGGEGAHLTVHEWGTFTSVNNSEGVLMEG